jgi:hypothetical protein
LRCLQLGGEALRPDGLLGVVLPSFILFSEKLADVFHGAFVGTREGPLRIGGVGRRSVIATQEIKKLEIKIEKSTIIRGERRRLPPSGGGSPEEQQKDLHRSV